MLRSTLLGSVLTLAPPHVGPCIGLCGSIVATANGGNKGDSRMWPPPRHLVVPGQGTAAYAEKSVRMPPNPAGTVRRLGALRRHQPPTAEAHPADSAKRGIRQQSCVLWITSPRLGAFRTSFDTFRWGSCRITPKTTSLSGTVLIHPSMKNMRAGTDDPWRDRPLEG